MTPVHDERERAFRECYAAHFDDLLAYAVRRVDDPADAADVVAETFLVAWRRFGDVPDGDEARLWLFGVARRVLANLHRGRRRWLRLGERLRDVLEVEMDSPIRDHADDIALRATVVAAMKGLGSLDREVLALATWEHLEPREIAGVLGIGDAAVRTRLSRARARLREALGDDLGDDVAPSGHVRIGRPAALTEECP